MLLELRVRNFAVIDEVTVHLGPGLNVLTGETGAGKSILVGALSLLLGERASSDSVRSGAEKAVVEAVFDLEGRHGPIGALEEAGFEPEDGFLILRREVWREGRNRAWVNGSPAAAGMVGRFGRLLVDLHGQHEHQTLLRPAEQRAILDAYAGCEATCERVGRVHEEWSSLVQERARRLERHGEIEARADFLRFQREEVEGAGLREGEDVELEEEARRLEHAEELAQGAETLHHELYAGERSLSDQLAVLEDRAGELARVDPELEKGRAELEEMYHRASELGRTFGSYAARVEHDPGRLEEVRSRLDLLARLKRKYGPTLEDVIETGRELRRKLEELEGFELELREIDGRIAECRRELEAEAAKLTDARRKAGADLEAAMEAALPSLGLEGATFRIRHEELDEIGPGGAERVEFLISLNPGFEPASLARVASGGELSRVMLALKSILADQDRVPTLVFDEIDAGVGGVVATRVSERLREVAERHQVLVITHLAQLASRGHRHLRVAKGERAGVAAVDVRGLEGDERVEEVARLLGGDPHSSASREHAKEMLEAPSA